MEVILFFVFLLLGARVIRGMDAFGFWGWLLLRYISEPDLLHPLWLIIICKSNIKNKTKKTKQKNPNLPHHPYYHNIT